MLTIASILLALAILWLAWRKVYKRSPIITRAEVIVPGTQTTRTPTESELLAIASFVEQFVRRVGQAPVADHTVDGVGEVLFMRDPSNPLR